MSGYMYYVCMYVYTLKKCTVILMLIVDILHKHFVFDARVLLLEYYKMNEFLITDFTYFSN